MYSIHQFHSWQTTLHACLAIKRVCGSVERNLTLKIVCAVHSKGSPCNIVHSTRCINTLLTPVLLCLRDLHCYCTHSMNWRWSHRTVSTRTTPLLWYTSMTSMICPQFLTRPFTKQTYMRNFLEHIHCIWHRSDGFRFKSFRRQLVHCHKRCFMTDFTEAWWRIFYLLLHTNIFEHKSQIFPPILN